MRISDAVKENVFPDVTACDADNAPVASKRLFVVSLIAKCVAVPVPVTDAPVIADSVTFRPFGEASAGADMLMLVVLPSVVELVAAEYVVGSDEHISTLFASEFKTVKPLSSTRSFNVAI
jgi:hypothetical protein